MCRKGLTLLEILVAALIMSMVMAGLASIFFAGKKHILHSRSRMQVAELGRLFLEPLQMQVRQDTWSDSNNGLQTGVQYCDSDAGHTQHPNCPSQGERTLDNIIYNAKYTINRDNPITNVNKVEIEISWTEPSP